jgi:hypothetical protein
VLVAALGQQRSGGFAIEIVDLRVEGSTLVVHVLETAPAESCLVTAALTAPADVVIASSTTLAVRFERNRSMRAC